MHRVTANAQVTLGLTDPQFKSKWGDHYTRSLICAHRLQQCHNYKVFKIICNLFAILVLILLNRTPLFNSTAVLYSSAIPHEIL
jgi:hypothetical protein